MGRYSKLEWLFLLCPAFNSFSFLQIWKWQTVLVNAFSLCFCWFSEFPVFLSFSPFSPVFTLLMKASSTHTESERVDLQKYIKVSIWYDVRTAEKAIMMRRSSVLPPRHWECLRPPPTLPSPSFLFPFPARPPVSCTLRFFLLQWLKAPP